MIRTYTFLTIFAIVILGAPSLALNFNLKDEHPVKNADFDILTYGAFEKNDIQYLYLTVRGRINLGNSNLTKSYEVNVTGSNGCFHIYIISPEYENSTLTFAATTWGRIFPFQNYSINDNNLTFWISEEQWKRLGNVTQIWFSAGEMSLNGGHVICLDRVYYPPKKVPKVQAGNFLYIYVTIIAVALIAIATYIFWKRGRMYMQ